MFVMTYTAACFDYKLVNVRPLKLICNFMKFSGLKRTTQLFKHAV